MPDFAVIVPAGGQSIRFGAGGNKLLADLAGRPVLLHTLEAFARRRDVPLLVLPCSGGLRQWLADSPQAAAALSRIGGRLHLCEGGPTRAHSVLNGLRCVPESIGWVGVHDAARPLISQRLIDATLAAAVEHGAAVGALPVALTIKQAAGPLPAKVQRTIPREQLWAMQTPQIMGRQELLDAFASCPLPLEQVTDDVQLLELAGRDVWLVEGQARNLKITTPADLQLAEYYLHEGE